MIQIVHRHVIQLFAFCPTVSVARMAQLFPAICHQKMCQWWSQSHLTMPSTTTTSNYTKKFSMESVKIQTVVTLRQHTLYRTNTPTIQLYKKLTAKVMRSQFIPLRKYIYIHFTFLYTLLLCVLDCSCGCVVWLSPFFFLSLCTRCHCMLPALWLADMLLLISRLVFI